MSHMIEENDSLMSVREVPWHGLGNIIEFEPDSYQALVASGLDWSVVQKDVYVDGKVLEGYKANVRDSDNTVLGIVSNRYKIVQNKDAFGFLDDVVDGKNTKYETAGSLRGGRSVWMMAKMPEYKILDDDFVPYVAFINTHDGTGSVRVIACNTRIVCNNTLNYALQTAARSWFATHAGDIRNKITDAKDTIMNMQQYSNALKEDAEELYKKKFSDLQVARLINELIPDPDQNMSDRQKNNILTMKKQFITCYNAPDLANYKGTGWGIVNAASDYMTHYNLTNRSPYNESRFGSVLFGNNFLDRAVKIVKGA